MASTRWPGTCSADKPIKGEMWFSVTDQPAFAVAAPGNGARGFTMVTCDQNEMVAPVDSKAMIDVLAPGDHNRWLRGGYDVAVLQRPYLAEHLAVRGPVFPTRTAPTLSP